MARRKNYSYANSSQMKTGLMVCVSCNKPITEGRYRYYETPRSFVNCHEACCADDPCWAELDIQARKAAERHAQFVQECREFRAKWGVSELDDYIPEIPHA